MLNLDKIYFCVVYQLEKFFFTFICFQLYILGSFPEVDLGLFNLRPNVQSEYYEEKRFIKQMREKIVVHFYIAIFLFKISETLSTYYDFSYLKMRYL